MAFGDFTFPDVGPALGLAIDEADLYEGVAPVALRADFAATLSEGATVALAINTEKAKSEFIIAPLLLELRRSLNGSIGLFSGVEFNVDPSKKLNGLCDFFIYKASRQSCFSTLIASIDVAKNDNLRNGLGQCIASTFAAALFNQKAGNTIPVVHGVVTTGGAWKFLRLAGSTVTLDLKEYYIDDPGRVLGISRSIVEG